MIPEEIPLVKEPEKGQPSIVEIVPKPQGFEYRVNGVRQRIRGVGYNIAKLDEVLEPRAIRYERDFRLLRAGGVNTIVGWDQKEFNELLLEKAAKHRLGVILPFELSPALAYDNPAVTELLMGDIRAWVEKYKGSPALRMWGLGNEVVHGIGNAKSTKAQSFARFLVRASDEIHRLDPDHPVIYRDAEDMFLKPVAEALARDGVRRPWFVYGMNFFTYRMSKALKEGPAGSFNQPLLISEFAPAGLGPGDRPKGYLKLWEAIRALPNRVLGGCAYVWTTEGPEPLDRFFGLTGGPGTPVDGAWPALAPVFQEEEAGDGAAGGSTTPPGS